MSVEKLVLATLSGPIGMFDHAIQAFVINRDFHPEDAVTHMKGLKALLPFTKPNPYVETLQMALSLGRRLKIDLDYKPFDIESLTLETANDYFSTLRAHIDRLEEEQEQVGLAILDNRQVVETLRHMHNVDEDLSGFLTMRAVKFRYGRLPRLVYEEARPRIEAHQDAFFIRTSVEEDSVYCMYFALPSAREQVDAYFSALQFERIWISEKVRGTPEEAIDRITEESGKLSARLLAIATELGALKQVDESRFLTHYSYIRFLHDAYELRAHAGHSAERFYMVGWIPLHSAESYAQAIEQVPDFTCILSEPGDFPELAPPVKQKRSLLARIYAPYLEMYGLPAYNEMDPGVFMAVIYSILFGMMFGDAGQGVILFLLGVVMYKALHMWLGAIISVCGISAAIFGFLYGSVFGSEEIVGGFHVLAGSNSTTILLLSAGLGVLMIVICMMINISNGIRQRDPEKIFFSANGICGMVFYLAAIFALASVFLMEKHVISGPYVVFLIILPLILMLCKEPLSKLIKKDPDWKPASISSFLVEGFFELFETALSFVSNTVSFLRVGIYAISHAGMMMVVYLLAETSGGSYNIVVLIIGNLIVMGLEALLVSIQVLRLSFYEIFGRFYDDGGVKFSPHIINYTKISND